MAKPSEILATKFPFEPTKGQLQLFELFNEFLLKEKVEKPTLLIRGYAGTGKTTMVSAVVQMLPFFNFKYVLMAPTGRAAKVMAGYSKRAAFTIHKKIFHQVAEPGGGLKFKSQKNYHTNTVFIVDEASMLSDQSDYGKNGLLTDLVDFVFSKENNRLLLIGDVAQLPPVGSTESPALEVDYLRANFKMDAASIELTEVMRQERESGILFNATNLRNELLKDKSLPRFITNKFKDIFRIISPL